MTSAAGVGANAGERMSTTHEPVLDPVSPAECRHLLASVPIGRLAFTVGALPTVQPVHFAVRADEVLIPARRGGKVEAASRGAVVAFEVDEYDAVTRTGWSVTVVGPSHVLSDEREVRLLEDAGLRPWAPGPNGCVIAVRIARITGQRLSRSRGTEDGRPTEPAAPIERLPRP
ncbi:pyridoxamine 5'-phosphate oxidase family protein [Blastococcus sp. URHD0036]|uniref:pyridoxamine 5'-phosphate oxidase family protein n=1 Tax=Blastococcus sp. URHD0036 TaxID=1380356 RepID=UPI0018CC5E27|nr:pyridoxamine 5'-phosphate oxidase family protein [Blastococcus sp. URHD0036]